MRSRVFAFFSAAALLLNLAGLAAADTHGRKVYKRKSNELVALLPASNGVATLDSRQFFKDAMPQILSSNQAILAEIVKHIDEIEAKTGIDLRKFDSVAIGMAMTNVSGKKIDLDPLAIARGDLRAGALIAIAKLASNGTYREEKYNERTIFVFSAKDVMQKTSTGTSGSKISAMIGDALDGLTHEIAVTALDENTLAFGSLARVHETLDAKTHVSPEVISLLSDKETSVLTFAVRTPSGMSALLPVDNDELGKNVNSIRFLSGSMDIAAAGASFEMMAKTVKAEQAQALYDTLDGLRVLGKAFLGGSKRADQRVYARLLDTAKIVVHGNTVTLDLLVPQADIDTMIGTVK
jgi:hypothetical protein